eukprot:2708222-Pyramimonas_sp.AAC.1
MRFGPGARFCPGAPKGRMALSEHKLQWCLRRLGSVGGLDYSALNSVAQAFGVKPARAGAKRFLEHLGIPKLPLGQLHSFFVHAGILVSSDIVERVVEEFQGQFTIVIADDEDGL